MTICTRNKKKLLCNIVGGGAFDAPQVVLTETGKIVEKYILSTNKIDHVTVEKYVVMPNHIHLLIFIDNAYGTSKAPSPTNAILPHLVSTLKRFCNRDIGANIFQRSFHDHVIRDENDYRKIWEYIDENPAKWEEDCFYCK